ncbi:tetratricopeptide repeat protein [Deinococcus cellulosilyticus]|uniref:Uncharacterized protein n=1 Tax=Deinococcus cellulosilyticus (strain DSM 18568 / NBRC 106333 / KACC 11606 / 5516J-15) TaxID=1223518 RepID=A0A511N644_DEIC1|nr:tetratricopeptide repeat protein [Deinococcus cellulosilyticus]GEM47881.1 hypothetical protein DC3_35160 [Deinococcus cellulosilyticus NBRC 106333 = KACC 11606]
MLAKHLMLSLMLSGAAFAQTRGAVSWFHPATPQDAETAALLSYDVALNFGLLKPHQTQVFTAPLLTPNGPQLPMDVLYYEGFAEPTLPEHLQVLQDALGVRTVIGGLVKGEQVTLLLQQGDQYQEVQVKAPANDLRKTTLKKVAELLKTSLILPKLTPKELALPLRDLEKLDVLAAVAPYKDAKDPVAKAFFESLLSPKEHLDQAYQAILQGPKRLLELNVGQVPSLITYQALYLEQNGQTDEALKLLATSKYPYAKTLSEVIELTRGKKLPESWPPQNRGVLTQAQAVILQATGEKVQDTREGLYNVLPNSEYALQEFSFLAFDRNDFKTARSVMERLVTLNPYKPLYWTNLGWAQYKTGNAQLALRSTQQTLQLDPRDEIAAYNLGLYHVALGNDLEAQDAYDYALGLGTYKDTQMAVQDLTEGTETRYHFYSGVLNEQLGDYPKALKDIKVYLGSSLSPAQKDNAEQIVARLEQARCDFELKDQPWFVVKGQPTTQLKQGQYLQADFNVRCAVVLPLPVTVKYTLSQNGEVVSAAEFTPPLKPSTNGFRINEALVPLFEVKDGELKSEIVVTGANGFSKTFTQTYPVQGQATLKERLDSAGLKLVNLYGTPVVSTDVISDLSRQVNTLLQDQAQFKAMYPGLTEQQMAAVSTVTPQKVEQALLVLLSRVGAELAPGSEVYFPDEYIGFVLQGQQAQQN